MEKVIRKQSETAPLGLKQRSGSGNCDGCLCWVFTDPLVVVFNSENNAMLLKYAHTGLQLYFLGFLFAGINILAGGLFFRNGKCPSGYHWLVVARCDRHCDLCSYFFGPEFLE